MNKRKSVDLLPVIFRTDANTRFLSGTIDQLIQQPNLKKIDGFIGSRTVSNYNPAVDSYINSLSKKSLRTDYELEPGIVIKNDITGQVEFTKTYDDILHSLKFFGSNINNQDRLFRQQSYAWYPHIDLDKFVNYRNYVWLPSGPPTVLVTGKEKNIISTIHVSITRDSNGTNWNFSNNPVAVNPTLTLYRGLTYIFEVDDIDNPFYIKTKRTSGELDAFADVTNNGAKKGSVVFEVKDTAPSSLFYVSGKDNTIFGKFQIRNITENTDLNVDTDIIGKKDYEIKNNYKLTNGMKIKFSNAVLPETYRDKTYIVEGVGNSIVLVDYESLVTIESYASEVQTSFDETSFDELPFDQVSDFPVNPDYILINRASKDKNPWSRYNRWFHIDVVVASSEINNLEPDFGDNNRASRPIIEFESNIQLFNFASTAKKYVDFLDENVTDAFSDIQGSTGYFIDGVKLENGNRVIFTVEADANVKNKVYEVKYLDINGKKLIDLALVEDSLPEENQGLLVLSGLTNGRSSWVYKSGSWIRAQQKTSLNQSPLFDLFDNNGNSFSSSEYPKSNFAGTKIFGYQVGTGPNDPILGFPLKYSNVANVGGYLFENLLSTDVSEYFNTSGTISYNAAKDGFLKINATTASYSNAWIETNEVSIQEIIDEKIAVGGEDYLEFNSIDIRTPKTAVRVFKNGKQLISTAFNISVDETFNAYYINFNTLLVKNDVIVIKAWPYFDKGIDGVYETPINLVNNPLNQLPTSMSYAEINDHVKSIVLNASKDLGIVIDKDNLRDISSIEKYGRRFVQHEGLVAMAGAMIVDKDINIINSIRWAALEYQKYKTLVLQQFGNLNSYTDVSSALDEILDTISKDKSPASPFYYSDMLPYGLNKRDYAYIVREANIKSYAYGSTIFDPTQLNGQAVLATLNGELLIAGIDYTFDTVNPLINFSIALKAGDKILIRYYNNINGGCMPYSPTKLGLFPAFVPKIYLDDTYIEPANVLQGHDGSLTVCYGDDRDLLMLELEKRVYNNLNSTYNPDIFDINDVIPGIFRSNKFELQLVNKTIEEEFLRWTGLFSIDYETNDNVGIDSSFSYKFVSATGTINPDVVLNGSWRKIYKYYFDTDRPHIAPWEMLGFSVEPSWWAAEYGTTPYTSGNEVMWKDLELGYIRQGSRAGYDVKYQRPGLSKIIPVNSYGELMDPVAVNVVKDYTFSNRYDNWNFGDMGPAENAWRRSHLYPFAIQIALALNSPAKYLTLCFDSFRNTFNSANQLVYKDTNQRLSPSDLKIFGDTTNGFTFATGYSPYIVENLRLRHTNPSIVLKNYINKISCGLVYKVGGFTSKDKFRVALETVTNYKTVDKVFIPEENYQLMLNVGTPVKTLSMSGIIVERGNIGYVVRGYDKVSPYFKINEALHSPGDPVITVGGVTEPFIYWSPNSNVATGTIVANGQKFYRAVSSHLTKDTFDVALYYPLPQLPTIGGAEAIVPLNFKETETVVPYGTSFDTVQEVFDFIHGYGKWLVSQGFVFETILSDLEVVADWNLAGKEFLFWSVQKWATNSVISLAPFADVVEFTSSDSVVDDLYDTFYDYTLLKSDGSAVDKNKIAIVREEGKFSISSSQIANDGVYFVKINLVQKEHVIVFDNFTMFNDLIYQPYSGYRQNRFKVFGYVTEGWQGDFYVPGFVYDSAKIEDWQTNIDYSIGDVVKFQTKYYQAINKLLPANSFNYEDWSLLGKAPVAQLLPNFEYKIQQFEDFYSLESENFDNSQKKFAQKLIGYVPRKYLNSLIVDETSQYKFYQGFIKEKGTAQPLEKFSVAHNDALGSHIALEEEWAIRLGTFGGENIYKEIEFTLDQNKFTQDPQLFEFEYGNIKSTSKKSYVISESDLLIKPDDFDGSPWPTLDVNSANGTGYLQYQKIPTAGYARIDDVTFTALYENNILTLSTNSSLNEGDTVWVAMDPRGDWTVKRYSKSPATIINYTVDNANNLIQFVTDIAHTLSLRDFVSVSRLNDPLNAVYEVIGINSSTTFVVKSTFNDIAEPVELLSGSLYYFSNSRFANLDQLSTVTGLARWQNCEFVWVDDDGTGNWAVYEKETTATSSPLRPYLERANQAFGSATTIAPYSKNIIVSALNVENGRVYIYNRAVLGSSNIQLLQSFILEENVSDILTVQTVKNGLTVPAMARNHGASIDVWENSSLTSRYIVSGAPQSSGAKWIGPNISLVSPPIRKPLAYTYQSSSIFEEGTLKILKFSKADDQYLTDIVLASPVAQAGANFGHCVKFAGTTSPFLIASAPGQDQKQGSVFIYYLDSNNTWQVYLKNALAFDLRSKISNISSNSEFGWSVAVTADGSTVVVSAPSYLKDRTQAHSGAVFIFEKVSASYEYNLKQAIYADDYLEPGDLLLKGVVQTYPLVNQTLSFDSAINTLTRSSGNFIADGFRIGQGVSITGSRSNNFEFIISDLTTRTMTFKDNGLMVDENSVTTVTITGLGTSRQDRFGDKVDLTNDGMSLFISSDHASQNKLDAGMVYVLEKSVSGKYVILQKIGSPSQEPGELFGSNISSSADGTTLLVSANGGSQSSNMYFDSYTERVVDSIALYGTEYVLNAKSSLRALRTTFDNGSTRFVNKAKSSGTVYLYQKMGNYYVYGESLASGDAATADGYGTGLATNGDFIVVGAPKYDLKVIGQLDENAAVTTLLSYPDAGTVVLFDKSAAYASGTWNWHKVRSQETGLVDVDKIKKVISYNTDTFNILENYEIFDPVKGKIPTKVTQEIKYITPFDPAVYTVAVAVNNKVRVDNKTTWTADHVGEMWLDTSTLRYVWYEQGSEEFRSNNWGRLFPGSTVDVYEWVKSDYRPSEWSELADTEEGLALGISGQPKNPDNTVVSINQYYDPIINDFVNVYYFWVRNKITLPDLSFRSISSFECARIIEDPKTQGIKYAAFLSPSSISLANTKTDLEAKKINIDVYYQDSETEINRHSHWQLINENSKYFNLDASIERKLFDSLVGQDTAGNAVPDPMLSPKLKYGVLSKPRQSWFNSRADALKTVLTFVNKTLANYDIVGKVDLTNIDTYELPPLEKYGYYDEIVETNTDLLAIGTNGKVVCKLSADVINGKLVSVSIIDPGFGYKIAPTVEIYGAGTGAKVQTTIDLTGKVISVRILSQGINYKTAPRLLVRSYSVLVTLDTDIDKWSIFQNVDGTFTRKISQTYDVRKFWNYIDWVDASYSTDTPAKFVINFITELETSTFSIGDTVQIRNTGDGRSIILRKTLDTVGNYINGYDLIYREQGTIQFSEKLYNSTLSGTGFDSFIRFDQNSFDESLNTELRMILESIKNDIFVGDLAIYWSKFIFVAIKHVLSEQLFVDWVYKTSFITPVINAGKLDQKDVYRFNDYSYVEEFIKEIKPYKSKFRDITTNQNASEDLNVGVTDFDLPAYVDAFGKITLPTTDIISTTYPYKHWYDHAGFSIKSITVARPGANYRIPPNVVIVPAVGDTGTGATAEAKISNGQVSSIVVTNSGKGYFKTPSVVLSGGGNYNTDFVQGAASANLYNDYVRTSNVSIKFDRVSDKGLFTGEYYNRNFTTDGITLNYVLAYPINDLDDNYPALQDKDTIKVFVNDVELSKDLFRITFRPDLTTVITFNIALPENQNLRIQYIKNILYAKDVFVQSITNHKDSFQLTFPPELDTQKMIVSVINDTTKVGADVISSDYLIQLKQVNVGFRKYVGFIQFKNVPAIGTTITVQYAKNINIQNAVDRIITSYEPTANMPGKDIAQLMKGIEFGGVEIQGLNFTVSSGWDGLPWFTQGWDTFVNEYNDLLVISDGTTDTYELGYTPLVGTNINVYFDNVRVDDENFGTVDQKNKNALFNTIISNGVTTTLKLPVVPATGVKIEIRQSLSDGVNLPSDEIVLDTNLTGGNFTSIVDAGEVRFKTASGLRPDDISVDGGQFLSVEHSPATEELVKGEIFDTLAITVFNSPSSGSNLITTSQFLYDGTTSPVFEIDGYLDSVQSLEVYIGNIVADRNNDFIITSSNNNTTIIELVTTEYGLSSASPTNKVAITIQKMSIGGKNILSRQNYIVTSADEAANVFEIKTDLNIADIGSYYISVSNASSLTKVSTKSKRTKVVIENTTPKLHAGELVTVIFFSSIIQTYSEVYNQEIVINSNSAYTLTRPPGNIEPLHVMAAVTRLTPSTLDWKGQWKENKYYLPNETVMLYNNSYKCLSAHYSLYSQTTINFANWVSSNSYAVNDIVVSSGVLYICIADHVSNDNQNIPSNTALWHVHFGNRPDEDYQAVYWELMPKQRMLPPETEYYEVTEDAQTFSLGINVPYLSRSLAVSDIEVYKNGKMMASNRDYEFDGVPNTVKLSSGVSTVGDVIAISVLRDADYFIRSGAITFTGTSNIHPDQKIVVTTYTNHDQNLMRREVFKGERYKNEYKVSRPIRNINDLWVDLNGQALLPNIDYRVNDLMYVQISEKFEIGNNDRIVITSISDLSTVDPIAYRMFKDMTNYTQFKRISKKNSTALSKILLNTDRQIEVTDASIFGNVSVTSAKPGVLFIGGERLEFRSINGNILSNITRGTNGTSIADKYPVGTKLFNAAQSESIPYKEGSVVKTFTTPANYRFDQTTDTFQNLVNGTWVTPVSSTLGKYTLTEFIFNDAIPYEDQVTVYLAGKILVKPARNGNKLIKHDFGITLDSDEVNSIGISGDIEIDPDFTITKVGGNYILQVNPNSLVRDADSLIIADLQIKIVQRIGKIWYTLNGTNSLQQDSTVQARFLQESPAELPDKYYYGINES